MNTTTTQEELANLIKTVTDGTNLATEFTLQHAPEILLWNTISSTVFFIIGVLMSIGLCMRMVVFIRNFSTHHEGFDIISILALLFGTPTCLIMISENLDWLQIMVAPKLYLIEYASKLVY